LCTRIDAVRASGVRPESALIDLASGKPFGQASYLNIDPAAGSIEVGGIVYAPAFQRGIAATEAMYLMMRHVFDELGYRRYAWQCNSLNARSRAGATRLGFKFEGVWRQANVHKRRNRDTAWRSIPRVFGSGSRSQPAALVINKRGVQADTAGMSFTCPRQPVLTQSLGSAA